MDAPQNGKTDEVLVRAYRQGSNEALAELMMRYASIAKLKVRAVSSLGADAEDASQELMVALLRAVYSYSEEKNASFKTYVGVCMDHALVNFLEAHQTQKASVLRHALSLDDLAENALLSNDSDDPEKQILLQEQIHTMELLISQKLSRFEKDVLFFYLADHSYEEISHRLNCTEKSVDNALQRIRRKLKSAWGKLREDHPQSDDSK